MSCTGGHEIVALKFRRCASWRSASLLSVREVVLGHPASSACRAHCVRPFMGCLRIFRLGECHLFRDFWEADAGDLDQTLCVECTGALAPLKCFRVSPTVACCRNSFFRGLLWAFGRVSAYRYCFISEPVLVCTFDKVPVLQDVVDQRPHVDWHFDASYFASSEALRRLAACARFGMLACLMPNPPLKLFPDAAFNVCLQLLTLESPRATTPRAMLLARLVGTRAMGRPSRSHREWLASLTLCCVIERMLSHCRLPTLPEALYPVHRCTYTWDRRGHRERPEINTPTLIARGDRDRNFAATFLASPGRPLQSKATKCFSID
jgi:hypothetical protein